MRLRPDPQGRYRAQPVEREAERDGDPSCTLPQNRHSLPRGHRLETPLSRSRRWRLTISARRMS